MSNLNGIPSADYFETKLANVWNWTTGTVSVEDVPDWSMPAGEYSYIVVNPWESNMQVAKIDGRDSDNKTFNVTDILVDSGAGTQYSSKLHPRGSIVRITNNYAFWKDIQDAVNSKADDSDISAVWKSNDYEDLDNLPALSAVALSNDYDDLDNKPTPVSIAVWDKVLELSGSNVLSATVTASYDSWTKKITLYGANSAVISEIDCTAFIKDGMIQDVKIVTDPVWYPAWKYLEFDFNTDSGVTDIYIALSDLAVYTAGEWVDITNNVFSLKPATASTLWWVKVWSWLTITSGTLSANSQTDENYTTAEKTKLAGIESGAEVNVIEEVQVNWSALTVTAKSVNVELKTINGEAITGSGDLDIMARHYTEWTGITINSDDEISISSAYQTIISNKANTSDLAAVATSGNFVDLNNKPTASDYDIKDLADSTSLRTQWSWKQDKFYTKSSSAPASPSEWDEWYDTTNDILKVYDGSNWIEVWSGSGDMMYADFNWTTLTGASVDLALASKITPTANFTVNAPATIKDGQVYVLRVENGATAYTMTLGTNITNPNGTDLTLTANAIDMFVFMAVWWKLELQPSDADTTYTAGTWISITSGVIANTWVTSVNGSTGAVSVPTGDVTWPWSSTDWHLAVFDGATWKTIKDWWAIPTVNDATLTISQWWVTKQTFSANASSNVTAELNTSFIMDEDDYTALPSSKESDGNFYFIFEDDEA